mmetsp:Transcript_3477/g.14207  ORF Transcript_3477/g.14207 Transcript_3477/m.14207 type:complete len:200 (+) Transcript_3477:1555-2154(+)
MLHRRMSCSGWWLVVRVGVRVGGSNRARRSRAPAEGRRMTRTRPCASGGTPGSRSPPRGGDRFCSAGRTAARAAVWPPPPCSPSPPPPFAGARQPPAPPCACAPREPAPAAAAPRASNAAPRTTSACRQPRIPPAADPRCRVRPAARRPPPPRRARRRLGRPHPDDSVGVGAPDRGARSGRARRRSTLRSSCSPPAARP